MFILSLLLYFVCVFQHAGDYTLVPSTVIGALYNDLQINLSKLSRDKGEDQRELLSCWWTKKLPKNAPYNRIMCFEGGFKEGGQPPATVSEVFRSLISLCKKKPKSVMMPILSTGNQVK